MIRIKIDFPAGRWHATAWGSHVNEGVPEWPPCPWRICRALLAVWHGKHHRQEETVLRSLLAGLAAVAPEYLLPEASAAHTRHFMPVIEGKNEKRTKVFDTFVHVNKGESLWIRWNAVLTAEERTLLATLLSKLNYMGRAESLVIITLLDEGDFFPKEEINRRPAIWTTPAHTNTTDATYEIIRLLAPQTDVDYQAWVASQRVAEGAKKKKGINELPESIFDAMQNDTADWKKAGRNLPPGSRWIEYRRPRDCFKIAPAKIIPRQQVKRPTVARFAVVSKVPPAITQALSLSERFHQTLCKILESADKTHPDFPRDTEIITGKQYETGTPLKGTQHTFFLPECDSHGHITHMTLYSPVGFGAVACWLFGKLRKVWGAKQFDVKIVLLATGHIEDFALSVPYFQKSKQWVSLTPFFPVRHAKKKTDPAKGSLLIGSPPHDCWRLLEKITPAKDWFSRTDETIPAQLPIRQVSTTTTPNRLQYDLRDIPCLHFQSIRRTGKGTRSSHHGTALQIEFNEPVALPVGVGYAAHFGLGLFMPKTSDGS